MYTAVIVVLLIALCRLLSLSRPGPALHGGTIVPPATTAEKRELLLASYNIHRARGTDGVRDIKRIAEVLADADFAGLFEVEGALPGWQRDQAEQLARHLKCGWLFAPVQHRWLRHLRGNGLLTRRAVSHWHQEPLPDSTGGHPRCLVTAHLRVGGDTIPVLMAHLARRHDQDIQLDIVFRRFLQFPRAILMGDFNVRRDHPRLARLLDSGQAVDALARARPRLPHNDRIDWILVRGLEIVDADSHPEGPSDHPCLKVKVRVPATTRDYMPLTTTKKMMSAST